MLYKNTSHIRLLVGLCVLVVTMALFKFDSYGCISAWYLLLILYVVSISWFYHELDENIMF